MRILIVEDDQSTAAALTTLLTQGSYAVETATDGESAADMVAAFDYDLLLLDVLLPTLDGISLCRQLRNQGYTMPILLLTANDNSHTKAVGLDAGADDYVVKPFDLEELEARIRALLRRGRLDTIPVLTWSDLQLDPSSTQVSYRQQSLSLTPKEYALLELLMRNSHRVFSCGMLLEHLWTYADMPGEEAVRTHIKGLRHKLRDVEAPPDLIETVYGIGYRLKPLSDLKTQNSHVADDQPSSKTQTWAAIATVWQRYRSRINDQVHVLEHASSSLKNYQGSLAVDQHHQAQQEAHSLAGALGMFGMDKGTELARNLEQILKKSQPLRTEQIQQFHQHVEELRLIVEGHPDAEPTLPDHSPHHPSLLVIDADDQWMARLTEQARYWDWNLQSVTDVPAARTALTQQLPHVILIDPAVATDTHQISTFLGDIAHHRPAIPVLFYGLAGDLYSRLDVAQMGGKAYLEKPIAPLQVLRETDRVLQQTRGVTAKVMIVDDDPLILQELPSLLEPWGFQVSTVGDARLFWQTLVAVSPDLLILDIEMPHVSGIELCQVVRHDPNWHTLPIIVLTAHTEANIVNQIFALGADDFVNKPVVGPELVVRLVNRLERMQLSQQAWQMDTLTRTYKRQPALSRLEALIKRAQTLHQSFCLALVKIANLRQINDDDGFTAGDRVLRSVGQQLCQGCGGEDVVARWSSNEFLIGLYGIPKAEAANHIQHLCQRFQDIGDPGSSILKLGFAQVPEEGTTLSALYTVANQQVHTLTRKDGGGKS